MMIKNIFLSQLFYDTIKFAMEHELYPEIVELKNNYE